MSGLRLVLVALLVLIIRSPLHAQSPRINAETVVTGLNQPLYLTNAHDGTNRRFIVEQPGRILVMQPDSSTRSTFLDISNRVLSGGERGLLGLTFHPQYATNRRFFVNYTRRPDYATVIAEYQASPADPNVANSGESVLLVIPQPYENHKGGMIEFGPDGYLYIGMGDGGSANDPQNRAQNRDELLGKILRIDVNSTPYASPSTNPFAGPTPGRDEIFALGMRNPWRFSFDRATGQLYAADVGQNTREEVDIITNGGNYGWRVLEGTLCTNLGPASCSTPGFIAPIAEYDHSTNGRCSITGGYVYRGAQQSLPYGAYIYGDYCSGEIFILQGGVVSVLTRTNLNISSFGEDESGEIYVVGLGGSIYRLTNPDGVTTSAASFNLADLGGFSVASAGAPNLTVGYSRIQVCCGGRLPEGMAIFGYRSRGILVSEASVPAMPLMQSGRIFAEAAGAVNTGIAIANPNAGPVTVDFYFTDPNGANFRQGSTTLPGNRQIAAFLNEAPFNGGTNIQGTFTFTASALVSAIALRGFTNERSEFLITTLPVAELQSVVTFQSIPHFADGGGWSTDLILVNPTNSTITGTIEWLNPSGQPISFTMPARYSIPPRSSQRFLTPGASAQIQTGSIQIASTQCKGSPGGSCTLPAPVVTAVFGFRSGGVTVTQAAIPGEIGGRTLRTFVENLGTSIQTGIALANLDGNAASISLELFGLDGTPTGLTATLSIPAKGQRALFLNQIPGFASLPARFQGVLQATDNSNSFAMTGLRGRYNERGEFLITTTSTVGAKVEPISTELLFPHFALGGGYEMQFVLLSGSNSRAASGTIYFFDQSGNALSIPFR